MTIDEALHKYDTNNIPAYNLVGSVQRFQNDLSLDILLQLITLNDNIQKLNQPAVSTKQSKVNVPAPDTTGSK